MRALILMLIAGMTSVAAEDRVLGRACGSISPEIVIMVVDQDTKAGISGAKVTFFSEVDEFHFKEIEAMRRAGREKLPPPPSGLVAYADAEGRAKLRCTFSYTEVIFGSGKKRNETYPEGQFRVECVGYGVQSLSAKELYPDAPYLVALGPTRFAIRKQPAIPRSQPSASGPGG